MGVTSRHVSSNTNEKHDSTTNSTELAAGTRGNGKQAARDGGEARRCEKGKRASPANRALAMHGLRLDQPFESHVQTQNKGMRPLWQSGASAKNLPATHGGSGGGKRGRSNHVHPLRTPGGRRSNGGGVNALPTNQKTTPNSPSDITAAIWICRKCYEPCNRMDLQKCPHPKCRTTRAPQAKAATTPTPSNPWSKATQQVLKPPEEEEVEEMKPETKEELEALTKQLVEARRWKWKSLPELEERYKELQPPPKLPQTAEQATKDMKVVAADQHNIQTRHNARLVQLEKKRDDWISAKKAHGEQEKLKLEEAEKEYKQKIEALKLSFKEMNEQADLELTTVRTKIQTATVEHNTAMAEITEYWRTMGKTGDQKPVAEAILAAAATTSVAGEDAIKEHLRKDEKVMNQQASEHQAAAFSASFHALLMQEKKKWTEEVVAKLEADSEGEEEEEAGMTEVKEGEDGFGACKRERRKVRRRAVVEGRMINDAVERTPAARRGREPEVEEAAKNQKQQE